MFIESNYEIFQISKIYSSKQHFFLILSSIVASEILLIIYIIIYCILNSIVKHLNEVTALYCVFI